MARADRGPLLSSLVLVGLATVATAALVLIGVQAGKISFSTDKSSGSTQTEDGGTVIGVDGLPVEPKKSDRSAETSSSDAPDETSAPRETSATDSGNDSGNDSGGDSGGRTPVVTKTTAPTTQPKPSATTTTSKPTATATTATSRPSPKPSPSQSTATTRPSPSPTPSPTCTATDRSGKCKQAEPAATSSSGAPTSG